MDPFARLYFRQGKARQGKARQGKARQGQLSGLRRVAIARRVINTIQYSAICDRKSMIYVGLCDSSQV